MPLSDWKCNACGHEFEAQGTSDQKPACPECQAADVDKVWTIGSVNIHLGGRNIPSVVEAKPRSATTPKGYSLPPKKGD